MIFPKEYILSSSKHRTTFLLKNWCYNNNSITIGHPQVCQIKQPNHGILIHTLALQLTNFKTNKLYLLCVRGGNLSTGINENSYTQNNFSFFPNPSNGNINVVSENNIDEIKITDILGQVIYHTTPKAKNISLKLSKKGIFFITTLSGKLITTQKILVND